MVLRLVLVVFVVVAESNVSDGEIVTNPKSQVVARSKIVLSGLVISGHKSGKSGDLFVEQSACAARTMIDSAVDRGKFQGDIILMAGPLGTEAPHDKRTWNLEKDDWKKMHRKLIRVLSLAMDRIAIVWDLVPMLLSSKYPGMKLNLNYMKLAVYELPYDIALFIDLDLIITDTIQPFIQQSSLYPRYELFGYRTCTAPVNSGFFMIRPLRDQSLLAQLDTIIRRNHCPCKIKETPTPNTFITMGYDDFGSTTPFVAALWNAENGLCKNIFRRQNSTSWNFAGAGTGQGLMWYFFGLKRHSYRSFTYAQLPFLHYNLPGPKPWSQIQEHLLSSASSDPSQRQHCDFVWWLAVLSATRNNSHFFSHCFNSFYKASLHSKIMANHFPDPACCRTCPGGGHFATSQSCQSTRGLSDYTSNACKPKSEISNIQSSLLSFASPTSFYRHLDSNFIH